MKKILIIGGGFSGTLLAHHLRQTQFTIELVEPRAELGRGIAYGCCAADMLLNVPAERMGAVPGKEDEFFQWCSTQGKKVSPGDFVPRALYGEYLGQYTAQRNPNLKIIRGEVLRLKWENGTFATTLSTGEKLSADIAVLACGILPRKDYFGAELSTAGVISDPWSDASWQTNAARNVVIAGTSLTAVDAALHLLGDPNRSVTLISRHGKLPLSHVAGVSAAQFSDELPELRSVRAMLKFLRARGAAAADWREVMDGMRGPTTEVWQRFPLNEQRRFLRHCVTYWDIHRHRLPSQSLEKLAAAEKNGRLKIIAGKISAVRSGDAGQRIEYRPRRTAETREARADLFINCLGPAGSPQNAASELFAGLLRDRLIQPHPNGIGLAVEKNGYRVISPSGEKLPLYTIGCWLRGDRWESTAVTQLRPQTKELAEKLIADS